MSVLQLPWLRGLMAVLVLVTAAISLLLLMDGNLQLGVLVGIPCIIIGLVLRLAARSQ